MARSKTTMTQASLRLPDSLWKRAEQLAAQMTADDPSTAYSRTDAIRRILEKHLPPLDEAASSPPKRTKPRAKRTKATAKTSKPAP